MNVWAHKDRYHNEEDVQDTSKKPQNIEQLWCVSLGVLHVWTKIDPKLGELKFTKLENRISSYLNLVGHLVHRKFQMRVITLILR